MHYKYVSYTIITALVFLILVVIYMFADYLYSQYLRYKAEYLMMKEQMGGVNGDVSRGNNKFCFDMGIGDKGDIVFSPLSITFALSLLHLGARGNTDKQLTELFGHKYSVNELNDIYTLFNNDVMRLTNALIINEKYKVNDQYMNMIKGLALVENRDFGDGSLVVKRVNDYIDTNTKGLIKNILKQNDVSASTVMVLINTIYFKADWLHEFKHENTYKAPFRGIKGEVDMMRQTNSFNYYENDKLQIIEMAYKNVEYVMGVILPKGDAVPKLSNGEFGALVGKLGREIVELHLPKFKHRKNVQLVPVLQKLGVTDLFNSKADLEIAGRAYVSNVIHEAVVIVDERGTEAAAVTVIVMKEMAVGPEHRKTIVFRADHEFIYYIRHVPTNVVLFYGDFNGNLS